MERVPEVIDCWFDSGAMPFAQGHWPFASAFPKASTFSQGRGLRLRKSADKQNQKLRPPKLFPADFICEAIDQTRGWFYTLLAISTLLAFGPAYKNVISAGHILDEKGEKMSKSKGNVVDPWYIVEKYGSDATRWYFYTINQPGDSKLFRERDVEQALKKFVMTFWNVYIFYDTYRGDGRTKNNISINQPYQHKSADILDKWMISRLNGLILSVSEKLDKYDITGAARDIEDFVIDDLSLWYIRRSRKRFQRPKNQQELKEASQTLSYVLFTLAKLTAPFVPFLSEEIYQKYQNPKSKLFQIHPVKYLRSESNRVKSKIQNPKSIHLCDWPKANKKLIDKKLEEKMKKVREIVAKALAQRAKAGIKVRQPLSNFQFSISNFQLEKELLNLIKEEINVKEIKQVSKKNLPKGKGWAQTKKDKLWIALDTKITPKLKEEGLVREVIRHIQEMRKKAGYKPKDKVLIRYSGPPDLNKMLTRNRNFILKEIATEDFQEGNRPKRVFDIEKEFIIEGQKLWLGIRKI